MSRTAARDAATRLIYQWQLGGDAGLDALDETIEVDKLDSDDTTYIDEVFHGVIEQVGAVDEKVRALDGDWKIERISKVELSIIRLAVYEMFYRDDVPTKVAINEAVELAKRYGSEQAGKFVNGVLGGVARAEDGPEPSGDDG